MQEGPSWLTCVCKIAWRSGTVPLDWQTRVVVPLVQWDHTPQVVSTPECWRGGAKPIGWADWIQEKRCRFSPRSRKTGPAQKANTREPVFREASCVGRTRFLSPRMIRVGTCFASRESNFFQVCVRLGQGCHWSTVQLNIAMNRISPEQPGTRRVPGEAHHCASAFLQMV